MRHLIISREYPPASYYPGGIGTYAANIARLMAERGEIVHVIAERWQGAPAARESFVEGRLVVHRIGRDDLPPLTDASIHPRLRRELDGLKATDFANQWFAWHAAFLAEKLATEEKIEVIEAQEWEAPAYYLLLRRALGIAEGPTPPCIVHLHAATAFIRHYNGALGTTATERLMERHEEFCVRAADALMCPSRDYAQRCIAHFGLPEDSIEVIPLPVTPGPMPERDPSVWASGSIIFVGRIQPQKGIIEWIEAAARVAAEHPDVRFDFVGADQFGMQHILEARVPPRLRSRFRFHGLQPRELLPRFLASARAAVVPSRWENFPNVCVEAMSAGLPVISTRLGGMVEMLEDGRTGWLTEDGGVSGMVDGLATALRRCLETPPEQLAEMGRAARSAVIQLCDGDGVVDAHLAFRATVAARHEDRPLRQTDASPPGDPTLGPLGAGVVVHAPSAAAARPLLSSLATQTVPPRATVLVLTGPTNDASAMADASPLTVVHDSGVAHTGAWNLGFATLHGRDIDYWLFLDLHDELEPVLLERLGEVFAERPDLGIVAPWTHRTVGPEPLEAPPCAELRYQLIDNDVTPASAFRAEALGDGPPFRSSMAGEFGSWSLANAALLKGWAAATLPESLAIRHQQRATIGWPEATALRAIRSEVLAGFAETFSPAALDLVQEYVPLPRAAAPPPPRRRARRYLAAIVRPRKVVRALRARI